MRARLDRYLLSEIVGPVALGFIVYTFILLLQFLFQSAEMIIRRGLAPSSVGKLLLLSLPNIVVLTIPMSLLFGILIAVGRLSSDSELIAMRSCGISLLTLYRPILVLSAFLTAVNSLLMIYALPWGNHALMQLQVDIMTQTVSQQVQPRVFVEEWEGKTLYVFDIPPGSDRWKGVFIAESIPTTQSNQITVADWGEVKVDENGERIVLVLYNAVQHKVNLADPVPYEVSRHKRLELILQDQFASSQRAKLAVSKGIRELTLSELKELAHDPTASSEQHNLAWIEIHKKFSIPAACMVFGLFALPLGFNNRRGGKSSGFALSIAVILVYYLLINNGEEAAHFGRMPPWLAMWAPNLLLAAGGMFLLVRRNQDKGLMLTRVDRWIRQDLWRGLLAWKNRRRDRRLERAARRQAQGRRQRRGLMLRLPRLRLAFPNILDRYVVRVFLFVFLLVLISGLSLYVLVDVSENIDDILKNKISNVMLFDYYKYLALQIFYDISPIIVLVTTLVTFSLLSRTNEITACKALGMSLYRIALPAVLTALVITLFCGFLGSEVLPASNERVAQIHDRIKGRETPRTYRRADRQWLFGQGRYIYNYLSYDEKTQSLQNLQVFDFDENHRLIRRLVAQSARYIGDVWLFSDGWAREFTGVLSTFTPFQGPRVVRYPETPSYFNSEIRPPKQMRYGELKRYIQELADSGQAVPDLEVELQNKIAYPVISLIMAIVALPFAFRLGRQGALYGVGLSIVLGMVFLIVFSFFTQLGKVGALPAAVAVWSPGAVFGILSAYLFLGVRT
ncbi:MAG: lipopolysaccharide export system permease protein lptG [Acidobacteriota bacterium]|nr:lipopolysaccharide export system permease protein lptG [Acidobacteriota bacterium]